MHTGIVRGAFHRERSRPVVLGSTLAGIKKNFFLRWCFAGVLIFTSIRIFSLFCPFSDIK